jgi:hypothetical protein
MNLDDEDYYLHIELLLKYLKVDISLQRTPRHGIDFPNDVFGL